MPSLTAVAEWLLPYRVYMDLRARKARRLVERSPGFKLPEINSSLRNVHEGQRCFILCNGPSVNRQDLSHLKNEIVFSVSRGYYHPEFLEFRPRYHCIPQISYGLTTRDDVVRWFQEMDERLGDAALFLSSTEEPLVTANNLFVNRKVRYVFFHDGFDSLPSRQILDVSRPLPRVQSVSIMTLMIAMYMGFKTIYLLGTDHDEHKTGTYTYFFGANILSGKDEATDANGKVVASRYDMLNGLAALWRQYRAIREIAASNGVHIFNATAGGELDEFPRRTFEDLFPSSRQQSNA